MTIIDSLYKNAIEKGDSLFLCDKNVKMTYAEVWKSIVGIGDALQNSGVKKYDKILILGDNSVNFFVLLLATLKIGAIAIPVNEKIPYRKYKHIVEDCNPQMTICINRSKWLEKKECFYYSDFRIGDKVV